MIVRGGVSAGELLISLIERSVKSLLFSESVVQLCGDERRLITPSHAKDPRNEFKVIQGVWGSGVPHSPPVGGTIGEKYEENFTVYEVLAVER